MAGYRLYLFRDGLTRGERHIARAITLECDDDAQAVREVEQHPDDHYMELWEGGRMVRAFEPKRRPSDSSGSDRPSPSRSS